MSSAFFNQGIGNGPNGHFDKYIPFTDYYNLSIKTSFCQWCQSFYLKAYPILQGKKECQIPATVNSLLIGTRINYVHFLLQLTRFLVPLSERRETYISNIWEYSQTRSKCLIPRYFLKRSKRPWDRGWEYFRK